MNNGIILGNDSPDVIIKKIDNFFRKKTSFMFHIVNLNPETYMLAMHNDKYRFILNSSNAHLIDGVGVKILALIMNKRCGTKLAGSDFMDIIIGHLSPIGRKILFLGGIDNTAFLTKQYFQKRYPNNRYYSHRGSKDIRKETMFEKKRICTAIRRIQPNIIFVAYGAPYQESWIYENKKHLINVVCMGVGGSFSFFSKKKARAPNILIRLNLEWLWRFVTEPKRIITKGPNYMYFLMYSLFLSFIKLTTIFCLILIERTHIKIITFSK